MHEDGGYRPADINGVVTMRNWGATKELLRIPDRDWTGKRILDVGSGKKMGQTERHFPGAEVHAVDPSFFVGNPMDENDLLKSEAEFEESYDYLPREEKDKAVLRKSENSAHYAVSARAQDLPYADGSFDLVMSTLAVPMNIPEGQKLQALYEMIRVTKDGGEVRVWPLSQDLVETLTNNGYDLEQIGRDDQAWVIYV